MKVSKGLRGPDIVRPWTFQSVLSQVDLPSSLDKKLRKKLCVMVTGAGVRRLPAPCESAEVVSVMAARPPGPFLVPAGARPLSAQSL